MIINQLLRVLEIPACPIETGPDNDWAWVTSLFGKVLPTDYMRFIDSYGSGEIGDWMTVFNPFSANPYLSLKEQFFSTLAAFGALKEEFPEAIPFPLLFEPNGLLPWGISIDGDVYCWQTKGSSGRWKVVVIGRHSDAEVFDLAFSEFLAKSITGEITCNAIPTQWASSEVRFVPYKH